MASRRRWLSLLLAPLLTAAGLGCAVGVRSDLKPEADPALPGFDAGSSGSQGRPNFPEAPPLRAEDAGTPTNPTEPDKAPDGGTSTVVDEASKPTQGEVLITEVMYDPSGVEPVGEWIEVHNTATTARSLSGLTMVDGANRTHVIGAGVTVAPGAYVVLTRSRAGATAAKVPAEVVVYEYGAGSSDSSGIQLSNSATGKVSLTDGATTIAAATYGGWFASAAGASVQLKTLTFAASGQSTSWCLSKTVWVTGSDKGTPGRAEDCP